MLSGPQNHSGVGSNVLYFDTPAELEVVTERITLFGSYTLTDAGIEANENVAGWIDFFKIEGVLKPEFGGHSVVITQFNTDEILTFLRACAPDDAISYFDGLPVTTEAQGFGFAWDQHIDWSMFESCQVTLSLRDPNLEWAGASALEAAFYLQFDEVPRQADEFTVVRPRKYSASKTDHDIKIPAPGVLIGGELVSGTADYISDVTIFADSSAKVFQVPKAIMLKPYWLRFYERYDTVPSDDTITYLKLPPVLVPAHADRHMAVGMSTAASLVFWPHLIVG